MEVRCTLTYIFATGILSILSSAVAFKLTNTCYIVPNISATPSVCPNTSTPCVTLSQFISNPTAYLHSSSHMDLVFLPGYHSLQSVLTLSMEDFDEVLSFGMTGRKSLIGVTINGEGFARLEFIGIPEIRIEHIKFVDLSSSKFDSISHSLLINNCSFIKGNGTALELENNGYVSLSNCKFISNVGSLHEVTETTRTNRLYLAGGALYLLENENIFIDSCSFINNSAKVGGVIYAMSSTYYGDGRNDFSFSHCSFLDNYLMQSSQDTSTYNDGGIFYCDFATLCTITVTASVFRRNINPQGLSQFAVRQSTIVIQHSLFAENNGAVINAEQYSKIRLSNNTFCQNINIHNCGGLFLISSSHLTIYKCRFMENS